jgi:ATP-dependent Clp protease adaptor protein ClpS
MSMNASIFLSVSSPRLAGTSTPTPEVDSEVSLDSPWNVIVHNDPINLMSYVTKVFMKVFGFTQERAEKHMIEVHKLGRSVVWTGERERGELFVQQLHSYLLLSTLERSR